MYRLKAAILVLALAAAVDCGERPASDAVVERLRVAVAVQPDGSLAVTETIVVRSFTQPPPPFERHLVRAGVDEFRDIRAAVVDAPDPVSPEARVVVDRSGDVQVAWPAGGSEQGRTFLLSYRAIGALEVEGTRAWLRHRILPLHPGYPIAMATVELDWPRAAALVAPPAVIDGDWAMTSTAAGATLTRAGITADAEAVLAAEFDARALTLLVPVWQQNADRAREMAPAFLAGALCIIVVGLGAIVMVRVQYLNSRGISALMPARDAGRGLVATGIAVLALGAASAAGLPFALDRYGPAVATIPASLLLVGVLLIAAGLRVRRLPG